jgi:hypothetical protein
MLDRVTHACGLVCNTAVALARATWLLFVPDLPSAVRAEGVLYRKRAPRHIALSPQVSTHTPDRVRMQIQGYRRSEPPNPQDVTLQLKMCADFAGGGEGHRKGGGRGDRE